MPPSEMKLLNLNKIENNLAENQHDSEDEGNARKSVVPGT